MEDVWKHLPTDLTLHVLGFLDAATRRDIGLKPKRLVVPPLKIEPPVMFSTGLTFIKFDDGTEIHRQSTWNDGGFAWQDITDVWIFPNENRYSFEYGTKIIQVVRANYLKRWVHPNFADT